MNDRKFERLAGLYVYCMDYHEGQNSKLYRILSRIETLYKPNFTDSYIKEIRQENLTYERLKAENND